MEFASFHTTLATLMVLDMQELVDARAIADRDYQAWDSFQADPARWFLKANDQIGAAVWKAIWRRRALDMMLGDNPAFGNVVNLRRKRRGKR